MAVLTTSNGPTETPPDTMISVGAGVETAPETGQDVVEDVPGDPEVDDVRAGGRRRAPGGSGRWRRGCRPGRAAGRRAGPRRPSPGPRRAAGGGRRSRRRRRRRAARRARRRRACRARRATCRRARSLPAARIEPPGGHRLVDEDRGRQRTRGITASRPGGARRVERRRGLDRDDRVGAVRDAARPSRCGSPSRADGDVRRDARRGPRR